MKNSCRLPEDDRVASQLGAIWITLLSQGPASFVVDDEIEIAQMLTVILQMNLFDAVPYIDPLEALEAADQNLPII